MTDQANKRDIHFLIKKWEKVGLLGGLEVADRATIAQCLENQALGAARAKIDGVKESAFTSFMFPMVRRILEKILNDGFVDVQAMALPAGIIHARNELDEKLVANTYPVVAMTRRLKAKWSPEMVQDTTAYNGIDAEAELIQIISDQIGMDLTQEFLSDMMREAFQVHTLNRRSMVEELIEEFITFAKEAQNSYDYVVMSPESAVQLESFPLFTENNIQIHINSYFPVNKILFGRKESYVYAPYILLVVTPTIYDPSNFTVRKGLMTRYAKRISVFEESLRNNLVINLYSETAMAAANLLRNSFK